MIVDTRIIQENARIIAGQLSPGTRLMAVVKANAYGHGAVETARAALGGGATDLGVATVGEAHQLRAAGIDAPILVLGASDATEAPLAAHLRVAIGVGDLWQAERLLSLLDATPVHEPLAVHLKIDSGMRRFGVHPEESVELAGRMIAHPSIELQGVYSHFADADDPSSTRMQDQLVTFKDAIAKLSANGIKPHVAHISNSAALLRNRSADFDMVRAGICLYGIAPSEHVDLFEGMQPALEWRATVQHIAILNPGDRTGYGGTYVATERERIAILPIGYADGYPRSLSNLGWVGYQGHRLPIRGRISMDQCVVGIPSSLQLSVGDEVTVIGLPASGAPTANELAALIDTIGYEMVARLSPRVPVDFL